MFNVFEIIRIESCWQLRPELVRSSLVIGVNSVQAIWSAVFWLTFPSAPPVSPWAAKTRLRWTRQIWRMWKKWKRRRREKMKTAKVRLLAKIAWVQTFDSVISSNLIVVSGLCLKLLFTQILYEFLQKRIHRIPGFHSFRCIEMSSR